MPSTRRSDGLRDSYSLLAAARRGAVLAFVLVVTASMVVAPATAAVDATPAPSDGPEDPDVLGSHNEPDDVNRSQDVRSIDFGDRVAGVIDEDDPQSDEYRGYHEPITFEGEAGQSVSIVMAANTRRGPVRPGRPGASGEPTADPYLMLVSPDGDVIARSDDAIGLNSRIEGAVLPEDGEYTIVATSYGEDQTFPYMLQLQSPDQEGDDLRSIDLNSTATGEIDKDDPWDSDRRGYHEPVTFEGEAGQSVRIDMGSQPGDTYLMLLDPNGNVIAENDDDGRSLNSSIDRTTLPQDGEYTIVATSFSPADTFEYELSVQVVGSGASAGADVRSISDGQTVTSELDEGDPSAPFLRGTFEPVTFDGQSGERVTIDMESQRGDTYLILYDPQGNVVARDDDGGSGLNSQIRTTLESSGQYTIIATSFREDDTFEYTLSLSSGQRDVENEDLRSIEYGETEEGLIDEDDPQSRIYRGFHEPVTFEGEAGDQVRISMDSEPGDTYLILLAPNSTVVAENDDYRGLNSQITTELPDDGEYTIIATSFNPRDTFVYELSLERTN